MTPPRMSLPRAALISLVSYSVVANMCINCQAFLWSRQVKERAPKYETVPASIAMLGQAELQHLHSNAQAETIMDLLFGTDCYSDALRLIGNECSHLSSEEKNRLALALSSCHMRQLGQKSPPCKTDMSLKGCADALDERGYATYLKFFTDIDSMCLFIQSQDFQKHTEHMLNVLYGGSRFATQALVNATIALEAQRRSLDDLGSQLGGLQELQAQVAQEVERGLEEVQGLQQQANQLGVQMQASVVIEAAILEKQAVAVENMREHELEEGKRASEANTRWEVAEAHATALIQEQTQYRELQQHLLSDLRELQANSNGLRESMAAVLAYAQRSDAVLVYLLGRSYSLDDIIFYSAGALAVLVTGTMPVLQAARVPLAGLFAGNLALERACLGWLSSLLPIDDLGQIMLPMPWVRADSQRHFSLKNVLRRLCLILAAALLLWTGVTHRNYEREALLELHRIQRLMYEAEQRQQVARQQLRLQILEDMERLCTKTNVSRQEGHPRQRTESSKPPLVLGANAAAAAGLVPLARSIEQVTEDRCDGGRGLERPSIHMMDAGDTGAQGRFLDVAVRSMPTPTQHLLSNSPVKGVPAPPLAGSQSKRMSRLRTAEEQEAGDLPTDVLLDSRHRGCSSKLTPQASPDKRQLDTAGTPDLRETRRKRIRSRAT